MIADEKNIQFEQFKSFIEHKDDLIMFLSNFEDVKYDKISSETANLHQRQDEATFNEELINSQMQKKQEQEKFNKQKTNLTKDKKQSKKSYRTRMNSVN